MKGKSYKDLDVWKKGIEIVDTIYRLTEKFPKDELYGLGAQMQRAAASIPSNIAEAFSRNHTKEYVQFLYVAALGSCAELETQLSSSGRRNSIGNEEFEKLQGDIGHESRMLMDLIQSLKGRVG
jgi:four helix bundle protein